jgi:hypothetical protein
MTEIAGHVAQTFKVPAENVAILLRTDDSLRLKFEHPPVLAEGVNTFPLATASLAGEVVKSMRGLAENKFIGTKHLAFYERIHKKDQSGAPIQKLLAAPIMSDQVCVGVIEVSRRGASAAEAGPDFTHLDQTALGNICSGIAGYLKQLRSLPRP